MVPTKPKRCSSSNPDYAVRASSPGVRTVFAMLSLLMLSSSVCAMTVMPWEGPICAVASSLKGQVAVVLSVVATIMIGIMFMYAETGGIVARVASWLLGMSCALSVVSIITALFPGVAMPGCL